jgi:Ca-activated chloride channel family protein
VTRSGLASIVVAVLVAAIAVSLHGQSQTDSPGFKFRSGVELINVTATVTDANGRFVPGLKAEDFSVFEDDKPMEVAQFSADRVPVSLGLLLDTSQSMAGEKFDAARSAIDRFLYDLNSPDDEFFLMEFNGVPRLLQTWTTDRPLISSVLARTHPRGGTAMYDAVADAIPLSRNGRNVKKAIVVISDGVDMASTTPLKDVHQLIRQSEALVYAVGIDCGGPSESGRPDPPALQRGPQPFPFPMPGGGRRPPFPGQPPPQQFPPGRDLRRCTDPVDVVALRDLTDDSGGRTEIIRDPRDLNPATGRIADELSKQYYLGYPAAAKKDGRWHTIRVQVRDPTLRVRARRGYVAS